MKAERIFAVLVLVAGVSGTVAVAGPYTDDLSKCLVSSTTEKDQTNLVRWLFSAAALHPDVSGIASVSAEQRTEMSKAVGQLFDRLLTSSCRTQFRDAMNYEGAQTLEVSFAVLGQVAMRQLMQHPAVSGGIAELDSFIDEEKIKAVLERD